MAKIILEPTTLAQWYGLVTEAEGLTEVSLVEEIESYLVFMLMRYTEDSSLSSSVLALEFLEGINGAGGESDAKLQGVGDQCLLYSGLFPGRYERKSLGETMRYFATKS